MKCRICQEVLPPAELRLGAMPLANEFLESRNDPPQETFPLSVTRCPGCSLWQLDRVIPPERLYRNYIYLSSISSTVGQHARQLAAEMIPRYGLDKESLVAEIASNDGTVLQAFHDQGIPVLGIEPARNIAALARAKGLETCEEFFDLSLARQLRNEGKRARLILARHVCAHVDDVVGFLCGVGELLEPKGVFVAEFPYLGELVENLEFDTIYHEHLSYFSLASFGEACARADLEIFDVEPIRLHGGSVLVHVARKDSGRKPSARLGKIRQAEEASGLNAAETLGNFARRLQEWKKQMLALVAEVQSSGGRLAGYGAAAKANTLLNYVPEVAEALECVFDLSPWKQGKWTPGTRRWVRPPGEWKKIQPSHLLLLAWNFQDEIREQLSEFETSGGKFVVPFPRPRVLAPLVRGAGSQQEFGPILVIGGTGLIGAALCREFSRSGFEAVALSRRIQKPGTQLVPGDLMNQASLLQAVQTQRPRWIVHAAGFPGGVNACEHELAAAERFFLEGTRQVVAAAKLAGASLVLLSTDAVFPSCDSPVPENRPTGPKSKYGQFKLASEEILRASGVPHLIIRTSNVYGWDPDSKTPNFLMQVLRALESGKEFTVSRVLRATPTWASDLARGVAALMEAGGRGVYHVVGEDYVSREAWARGFARVFGLPENHIRATDDSALVGSRPILRLDSTKIRKAVGWTSLSMEDGLQAIRQEREHRF